jgi:hypothetical protein
MILLKKIHIFQLKSLSRLYRNSAKVCSAKAFLMQFEFNAPSLGPPNRISGFYQENHVGIKVVRHPNRIQKI